MKVKKYKTELSDNGLTLVNEEEKEYGVSQFQTPESICKLMTDVFKMHLQTEEYVYMLALDSANHLIGVFEISHGSVNASICSCREIFQKALIVNASSVVIVHNHPSGSVNPSREDKCVADEISKAGTLMRIPVLDNIIIGGLDYYSFKEKGIM